MLSKDSEMSSSLQSISVFEQKPSRTLIPLYVPDKVSIKGISRLAGFSPLVFLSLFHNRFMFMLCNMIAFDDCSSLDNCCSFRWD